jgi:hypothetical protein
MSAEREYAATAAPLHTTTLNTRLQCYTNLSLRSLVLPHHLREQRLLLLQWQVLDLRHGCVHVRRELHPAKRHAGLHPTRHHTRLYHPLLHHALLRPRRHSRVHTRRHTAGGHPRGPHARRRPGVHHLVERAGGGGVSGVFG